jgi:hypothetical protein
MTKVISFSLWGQDLKYCIGAIRNADLAQQFYPDWQCVFQLDAIVPNIIEDKLNEFENTIVIRRIDPKTNGLTKGDWRAMMWRFELICEPSVEVMLVRDCDSRLSAREAAAVEEWMVSDKQFHSMRDHVFHSVPILGGLWGMKQGNISRSAFKALLDSWPTEDRLQTDQEFLAKEVWVRYNHHILCHDDGFFTHLWGGQSFPSPRSGLEFVGQVYDEHDVATKYYEEELSKWLCGQKKKTTY